MFSGFIYSSQMIKPFYCFFSIILCNKYVKLRPLILSILSYLSIFFPIHLKIPRLRWDHIKFPSNTNNNEKLPPPHISQQFLFWLISLQNSDQKDIPLTSWMTTLGYQLRRWDWSKEMNTQEYLNVNETCL